MTIFCRISPHLVYSSGALCLSLASAFLSRVTLSCAVCPVLDTAAFGTVRPGNFWNNIFAHVSSKRSQGTWVNNENQTSLPPYRQALHIHVQNCITLHSYQLCVNGGIRDLLVEINSPWDKIVICCPLFHPARSSESFPEKLSVPPWEPWMKMMVPECREPWMKMLVPEDILQNHRDFNPMRQIHVFSSSADGLKCHLQEKALSWHWWEITQNGFIHTEQLWICHHQIGPPHFPIPEMILE